MRVAIVSTFPPSKEGIAEYTLKLVFSLSKVLKGGDSLTVLANVDGHEIGCGRVMVQKAWTRNSLKSVLTIFHYIIHERIDIIHLQHEYLLYGDPYHSGLFSLIFILLKAIRKRVIVTMHSVIPRSSLHSDFFERYGIGRRFATFKKLCTIGVTKLIGLFSDMIIVHNLHAKKELIRGYRFEDRKISIIPHGVDTEDPVLEDRDRECRHLAPSNLKDEHPIILYFGFVRPGKGIEFAIKAMREVLAYFPNARLVIAGGYHPYLTPEGVKYIGQLKKIVSGLNLNGKVVFTERFIPNEELPSYFSSADIFVMPYTEGDIIGASGVLSRVACYGKPIVATNIPRFNELIDETHGLIVPPCSSRAIAKAIIKLLSNPSLRQYISQQLKSYVKNNSWERVAERTLNVYYDMYAGSRNKA